ncbi:MAG: phosphatase [Clostridiaceae bacterium]|nr:phosphatase [Clostridiaceae bacterium]
MSNREQEEQKAIRKAKNDYMKRWRRRNPDKVKANTDRYWLKKAEELKNEAEIE